MRRSNWSLTIAICISLCVHVWAIHAVVKSGGGVYFGAFMGNAKVARVKEKKKKEEPVELVQLPAPPKQEMPTQILEDFGQPNGKGAAINAMDGERPLRAKQSPDEQASLSRHPGVHREGEMAKPQAAKAQQPAVTHGGNNGAAAKMLAVVKPQNSGAKVEMVGLEDAKGMKEEKVQSAASATGEGEKIEPMNQKKIESLNHRSIESMNSPHPNPPPEYKGRGQEQTVMAENQTPRKAAVAAGNGGGKVAGEIVKAQPALMGDPGEKSDSDSDAFSNVGSAVFEAGKLEARFGRRVRATRPNFPLVSQMDLANIYGASVQLEVHADSTGKPTDVEVIQSSGLNDIDEPVRLALYDWWFEPPKDKHGKPVKDVMVWTISFR